MQLKGLFSIVAYLITSYLNMIYSQKLPVLDLAAAIDHPTKLALSDFIENLTYIPLETDLDCLIDVNPDIKVTKDFIVVTTEKNCQIFNRKNGSFIREVGHYGRGPGEYRSTIGFLDELSSTYYFIGWNGNLIRYSLDGKFMGSLKIPGYKDGFQEASLPDRFTYLNNNLLVCNFMNLNGSEKKSLMIFNTKGEIVRLIPNRNIFRNMNLTVNTGKASFHRFNNSVFFQEFYNDTVFKITTEGFTPHFILNRGKYRPSYESLWWPIEKGKQAKLINQPLYRENSRFISFDFYYIFNKIRFFALYDKTSKSLKINENIHGITNDIDGFMDLTFKSINESGELSCLIQSEELIRWLENNKDKSKSLKPKLQNLKNTKLGDNPIVIIAKYKQ